MSSPMSATRLVVWTGETDPWSRQRLEASSFFPKEAQVSLPKAEGVSQERMSRRPLKRSTTDCLRTRCVIQCGLSNSSSGCRGCDRTEAVGGRSRGFPDMRGKGKEGMQSNACPMISVVPKIAAILIGNSSPRLLDLVWAAGTTRHHHSLSIHSRPRTIRIPAVQTLRLSPPLKTSHRKRTNDPGTWNS